MSTSSSASIQSKDEYAPVEYNAANKLALTKTETQKSLHDLGIESDVIPRLENNDIPVQDPMFPEEFTLETQTGLVRIDTLQSIGRSKTHQSVDPEIELVTFLVGDPENPHNWPMRTKWFYTFLYSMFVICSAYGSSCISAGLSIMNEQFHVVDEVSIAATSLMVFGFSFGPLIWAPMSERIGRKPVYFISYGLYVIFQIPCALAPNITCLLICRFLSGVFALSGLTNIAASLVDIHDETRALAIAFFAFAPYSGPVIGAIVNGFIVDFVGKFSTNIWVNMGFAGVMWIVVSALPETCAPVILRRRAARLRMETGNPKIMTEQELSPVPFKEMAKTVLLKPLMLVVEEPVLVLMCGYVALVYSLLYAFFYAYPYIFSQLYGYKDHVIGMMFIPILIGAAIGLTTTPILEKKYTAMAKRRTPIPEDRLIGAMIGGPFPCIALFILGATSFKHIIWVGPASSGIAFGYGMILVYYSVNNYIIDTYAKCASSALATKVFIRSSGGAAFPLFITYLYERCGLQWGSWLLAFISVFMAILPFLFYYFGVGLRARLSKTDYTFSR